MGGGGDGTGTPVSTQVEAADNALVTLEEVKRWLKLTGTDSNRDDMLQETINDWSDTIEKRLGRMIKTADYTDEKHDGGKWAIILINIPVIDLSSVKVDGTALSPSDYTWDINGIIKLKSRLLFNGGPGSILVSYRGGYGVVPGDIKRSLKQIIAIEFYLSGQGKRAIAKRAESSDQGNVTYERGPWDQEQIMQKLERLYKRR